MNIKDQAKSINKRLSNMASERRVGFQSVATEFLIERLLARLLEDPLLAKRLIFKGGFVAMRLYESPRYTVDLDAIADRLERDALIIAIKEAVGRDLRDAGWFKFQEHFELETQGEYGGIRFVFRAGIGEPLVDLRRAQVIHLDIGFGDPVTPNPLEMTTPSMLDSKELKWRVYPIETMIAEKLQALISRGDLNSRSKDVLDLSIFIPQAKPKILKEALKATFRHCDTDIPTDLVGALKKVDPTVLEKGWAKATGNIRNAPTFKEAYDSMCAALKKIF